MYRSQHIKNLLHTVPPPVFIRDYGAIVYAEYRVGPEVTCEARVAKNPDGWIVDQIETLPDWRRKGHARAVLERLVSVSGMAVHAMFVEKASMPFWERMTELGINKAEL